MTTEIEVLDAPGAVLVFPAPAQGALATAEARLSDALARTDRAAWEAAHILYQIHRTGVWKEAYDPDGRVYTNFEAYLRDLRSRIPRLGVRWGQEMVRIVGTWTVVGMDPEQISAMPVTKMRDLSRTVDYDVATGQIAGYRVPGGRDEVIELVRDAATMTTADVRQRVRSVLGKTSTHYHLSKSSRPGSWVLVIWHDDLAYECDLSQRNALGQPLPDKALRDLRKRLGLVDE